MVGENRGTIVDVENGHTKSTRTGVLAGLAEALGTMVEDLIQDAVSS